MQLHLITADETLHDDWISFHLLDFVKLERLGLRVHAMFANREQPLDIPETKVSRPAIFGE